MTPGSTMTRVCVLALFVCLPICSVAADFGAGLAAYERADYAAALHEWLPLADNGVVEAQYNVGLLHYHGQGVPHDPATAHTWYLKAAEGGYARARYRVAEMFESGDGVRKDLVQAYFWYRLAGQQKYADAKKRRRQVAKKMTPEQIAYADMQVRHHRRDGRAAQARD